MNKSNKIKNKRGLFIILIIVFICILTATFIIYYIININQNKNISAVSLAEDINNKYKIWEKFNHGMMENDWENNRIGDYALVKEDNYKTTADMKALLSDLFAPETVGWYEERLFSHIGSTPPLYKDIDGKLYIYMFYPASGYATDWLTDTAVMTKDGDMATLIMDKNMYDKLSDDPVNLELIFINNKWLIKNIVPSV